jgi:NADPH:quinone reductase-like Zn-dependent oxidoreductase
MPPRGLAARRCAEYRRAVRAVVFDRYGPPEVLRLEERDRPVPADDQVLIRVRATSVTRTDAGLRSADIPISRFVTGLLRPKPRNRILGMEVSGTVEAAGAAVTAFAEGDEVFGIIGAGAHAEYVAIRETAALAHKPSSISFEEAAAVCDGMSLALPSLEAAGVGRGTRLLIYGASGSVGTAAVQLARHLGAHVTAVTETRTLDLVRSLGADEVVDYTAGDFTDTRQRYDAIFDAVGKISFRRTRHLLKRNGTYVDTDLGAYWHLPALVLATKLAGNRRVKLGLARFRKADVELLKRLIEAGEYRAVIDRTYPLDEIVEATRFVETERKVGNVVITVASD